VKGPVAHSASCNQGMGPVHIHQRGLGAPVVPMHQEPVLPLWHIRPVQCQLWGAELGWNQLQTRSSLGPQYGSCTAQALLLTGFAALVRRCL
jgi:hypothetical protein